VIRGLFVCDLPLCGFTGGAATRWNFVTFATSFRDSDGDGLLAAFYRTASAGFELSVLELVHHLADFVGSFLAVAASAGLS
jgi:hypothetical protein